MATQDDPRKFLPWQRSSKHYFIFLFVSFIHQTCSLAFFRCLSTENAPSTLDKTMTNSWCHSKRECEQVKTSRRQLLSSSASLVTLLPTWSRALSPEEASTAYDSFATTYDQLDGGGASTFLGLDDARSETFRTAKGNVLEIGVGTGLNLNKYETSKLASLTLVDISEGMLQQAKARATKELAVSSDVAIRFVKADATSELVPMFGENKFDTVIDSFSLCVMGNDGALHCLKQLSGVVKPKSAGGRILLLENSRSSSPLLGWYQDLTADAAASVGGKGCFYNQNVSALVKEAGLIIEKEVSYVGGLFRGFECTKT